MENNNSNNDNTTIMENGNNGESDWRNNLDFMEMMMKIERRKFMTNEETDEYYKQYKQQHDISKDRKINLDLVGKLQGIDGR